MALPFTLIPTNYSTTQALLRACRQGDAKAWEQLVDKYERLVFSTALNQGLSYEDAADVTQLTFTILLQSLDTLREEEHLGAWLATVARRHTWRLLRRNGRTQSLDENEHLENLLPDEREPTRRERQEKLEWLLQGLAELGTRCRELLSALYFDKGEPSYQEIAARLGMQVGSIGPTRIRCLSQLREIMEKL
ncbi:MAG TPA: sigma-70 family RNA polymerase sigma factor [Anaerolineales bacterium]|nr:sigma-70 family RNA polymerase sigma factor [Anaerolineales bacterium]